MRLPNYTEQYEKGSSCVNVFVSCDDRDLAALILRIIRSHNRKMFKVVRKIGDISIGDMVICDNLKILYSLINLKSKKQSFYLLSDEKLLHDPPPNVVVYRKKPIFGKPHVFCPVDFAL